MFSLGLIKPSRHPSCILTHPSHHHPVLSSITTNIDFVIRCLPDYSKYFMEEACKFIEGSESGQSESPKAIKIDPTVRRCSDPCNP